MKCWSKGRTSRRRQRLTLRRGTGDEPGRRDRCWRRLLRRRLLGKIYVATAIDIVVAILFNPIDVAVGAHMLRRRVAVTAPAIP